MARGESWPQIPRGKKEAKGQAWSVRVVDTEGGDRARQEWGQRDTGREGYRKDSWGVIRRKINLFRGAESSLATPPKTKCRLRISLVG